MKILADLSVERAKAGGAFPPRSPEPLALELAFTETFRRLEHAPTAEREIACLRVMFPAVLQPPADGDLFAGRIAYPLVGHSPEAMNLGYYCLAGEVRAVLDAGLVSTGERPAAETMLTFWEDQATARKVRAEYPADMVAVLPSDEWQRDSGVGFPLYRIGGSVLDYDKLLRLGLPGLRAAARQIAPSPDAFAEGVHGACDIFAISLEHYAAQADTAAISSGDAARGRELRAISAACRRLREHAPANLFEAIQLIWLWALHAGTWNYGRLDDILGPFLVRDLQSGRLDQAEAVRLLAGWWRLMKAYDNQYNNRVIIGGIGRKNTAAADVFAHLALEATRLVRLNQPQLSLRFHRDQDPALMTRALEVLGAGTTFPILYNDDVNVPAVARAFGVSEDVAADYTPYGCGEYVLGHHSMGTPSGVINLAKAVELALHDGYDHVAERQSGPHTSDPATFKTFEDLWRAYVAQVEPVVAALALQERIEYDVAGRETTFTFISALYDDCLARGRPLLSGGVRYLGGTLETYGNTNAADSLHAIEQIVFVRKALTLPQIIAACDANFAGPEHVAVRRQLVSVPKYGNDDPAADAMATRVHRHICELTKAQATRAGLHTYLVVIINNSANVTLGRCVQASADGRQRGEPLANGNNPSPGMDRAGTTAFLNSLSTLAPDVHAGAVQNMKFSRELFARQRPKLEALLAGYWARGGTQAMITAISPDDLRAALREPEKWGHLMVRVGGFSARFVDLPRDVQEEILQRTLHE